jgi:ATP-dependent exoDNAse (exonuclease V) alpha subunit
MTTDACFIAIHERMSDREWSYVAASRARHETGIYCTASMEEILDKTMSLSHQKDTSLDYKLAANQSEALENRLLSQNKQHSQVHLLSEEELDFD